VKLSATRMSPIATIAGLFRQRQLRKVQLFLPQRHPSQNGGTLSGAAIDIDRAAEQNDSLPHTGMTQAGAMLRNIEASAIVLDGELQSAVQALQANLRPARSGMAGDIAHPLLRDAKQA
jgi:hypothetical protein